MKKPFDMQKEWAKTKEELLKFSKQATEMAKKGEKELVKLTHQGGGGGRSETR